MDGTLIILVLLVLMYVVLFLPRQRQMARQRAMQSALAPGDEIVTIGGIRGTVTGLTDDALLLEVSPGVEVRFVREAVAKRLEADPSVGVADDSGPSEMPTELVDDGEPTDEDGSGRS